jgi:hypothetical protein
MCACLLKHGTNHHTIQGAIRSEHQTEMCSCIAGQLLLWQMRLLLGLAGLLPKEICPGIHLHNNHKQIKAKTHL